MKTTGIIAEYNPFHNGHKYHIEEARRVTGADYVIAVISGDFVQRGAPAIADKYLRAKAALLNGADLALELPVLYATGSAEYFAAGAVTLLDRLGVVDSLCFGSECGSIPHLSAIASLLAREPELYRRTLQTRLKHGCSFPNARNAAIEACSANAAFPPSLLSSPNNILGIEYIKMLLKRNSSIIPYTIKRKGRGYHDSALEPLEAFCSATAIRKVLTAKKPHISAVSSLSSVRPYLPDSVSALLGHALGKSFPICKDDFSSLLHYKLLQEMSDGFCRYLDISADLSDKICRNIYAFSGYGPFCRLLKSKDITYSRISRGLLHILLDVTQEQSEEYARRDNIAYARILGLRRSASPLLKKIKQNASVPLLSKLADAPRLLSPSGLAMLKQDIHTAHIYESIAAAKFHAPFQNEYARQLAVL